MKLNEALAHQKRVNDPANRTGLSRVDKFQKDVAGSVTGVLTLICLTPAIIIGIRSFKDIFYPSRQQGEIGDRRNNGRDRDNRNNNKRF